VFAGLAEDRFPQVQASLAESGGDPSNRMRSCWDREVVQLLRDVVPDGWVKAVDQHVALLHNCYLFWHQGSRAVRFSRERAEGMLTGGERPALDERGPWYLQLPERLVWAQLSEGDPHETAGQAFLRRRWDPASSACLASSAFIRNAPA
jgi:hypothetical protein